MQAFRSGVSAFAVDGLRAGGPSPLRTVATERRPHAGVFAKAGRSIRACAARASRNVFGRLRGTLKIFDNLNNLT